MSRDLSSYTYDDLHDDKRVAKLCNVRISLGQKKQLPRCDVLCLLRGTLVDKRGVEHVLTGEAAAITGASRIVGSDDILYLTFTYGKTR